MTTHAFNTIQYCIDNSIQCFTFKMDSTKTCKIKWSEINDKNFTLYLNQYDNGFAIKEYVNCNRQDCIQKTELYQAFL